LITADEVALGLPRADTPATAPPRRSAARLRRGLLHATLFVTVLLSSFAMIEPSPHDVLIGVLALAALIAGVGMPRRLLPMILLLAVWNVSGLFALFELATQKEPLQYAAISFYLATAAILFAAIAAQDSVRRMEVLRLAYVLSAVIASAIGILAYFRAMPGADQFLLYGRVKSTFKDPNVFGPFLVLPLLLLVQIVIARGLRLMPLAAIGIIAGGLFLSFSRGAWFHTALSAAVMIALMVLTARSQRERVRIVGFSGFAVAGIAVLVVALLSVGSLRNMLMERAQLIQSYDVGTGGRFQLQELALGSLLDAPLGLGPFEFARIFGLQQHNVYLQAFLVYGWVGGTAYIGLVGVSLAVGLRAALIRTPWQPYLIAAYGAFVGEVAESFIIDSDHWRHYFLILGLVWGLAAATLNARSRREPEIPDANPMIRR
jgi:hypothetical protein